MYISKFQLTDYKSYLDSGQIELSPGMNIVVGPNNAGKTALLEGLSLKFTRKAYRGAPAMRRTPTRERTFSSARIWMTVGREELFDLLGQMSSFAVPLPEKEIYYLKEMAAPAKHARRFVENLLSGESVTIQFGIEANDRQQEPLLIRSNFPAIGDYRAGGYEDNRSFAICDVDAQGEITVKNVQEGNSQASLDFGLQIARMLLDKVYLFRAERVPDPTYPVTLSDELQTNAANLANAIGRLRSVPSRFRKLNEHLRYVLPQVYEVDVREVSSDGQYVGVAREVLVFEEDSAEPVPLSDSGTGVSQVLTMLYVLAKYDQGQTIIIDEPQSFLHPGAVRKLFEVIGNYPQHQYVVSTHSPQVIDAATPPNVILVTKERGQPSNLKRIDPDDTDQLRLTLHAVGARMSDVFGADRVLWVEGATERDCFPLIMRKLRPGMLMGIEIVAVISPDEALGDEEAERLIRISRRLSEGRGLLPAAVGFIFDRECKTALVIAALERMAERTVRILPRRMYENYLLKPEAIAAVLHDEGLDSDHVTVDSIAAWINEEIRKPEYYCNQNQTEPWVEHVHAAKLLDRLFTHYSGATLFYMENKVEYGVKLTRWLLEHDPDGFSEVAELIESILPKP